MNAQETMQVLLIVAGSQGRSEIPPAMAAAWAIAFEDVPVEIALQATKDALKAGGTLREPRDLKRHTDPLMHRLARAVRSAKARGLVPASHKPTQMLPPAAADRLRREFEATNDYPDADDDTRGAIGA